MRAPDSYTPHRGDDDANELWAPDAHGYTVYPFDECEPEDLLGPDGEPIRRMVRANPIGFHEENGR
jgi:hypothetical protein